MEGLFAGARMAIVVIAFACIGVAIWVARLSLPLRRSMLLLLLAALAIGVLDGLGFVWLAWRHDPANTANPQTGAFDSILALQMFALAALPAALLALVLSVFAWLVFRPTFRRKDTAPG